MLKKLFWGLILIVIVYKIFFSDKKEIKITDVKDTADKVAVIDLMGDIITSQKIIEKLEEAKDDDNIKAIIIRINSPGGAVGASQEIYREIIRVKEKKPVICSIENIAASGAYYVASACDSIVANKGSLIGSIGVIMFLQQYKKLFDKIGIKTEVIKTGKFKDVGNPFRELSKEEREYLQNLVNITYQDFLDDVYSSRKGRIELDTLKKYADGRVITGTQALKLGFIDKIGNFYDAVDIAEKVVGKELKIYKMKKKKKFMDILIDDLMDSFFKYLDINIKKYYTEESSINVYYK